jgi:hypothetical protein
VSFAVTNFCNITEFNYNGTNNVVNGTNCVVVKVEYSGTVSMWTSTNLISWVGATYLKVENPGGYANPKWRKFYYKKDEVSRFYQAKVQ